MASICEVILTRNFWQTFDGDDFSSYKVRRRLYLPRHHLNQREVVDLWSGSDQIFYISLDSFDCDIFYPLESEAEGCIYPT